MENASKALLIAGELLIAMLVASTMMLLFSTMSSYTEKYAEQKETQEVQAFNANITQYAKSEKCTAQDIVSLINFAKQINQQLGCTGTNDSGHGTHHINIEVEGTSNMELYNNNQLIDFLQTNSGIVDSDPANETGYQYYKATLEDYFEDGRIRKVSFVK